MVMWISAEKAKSSQEELAEYFYSTGYWCKPCPDPKILWASVGMGMQVETWISANQYLEHWRKWSARCSEILESYWI